ncbi:MAG: ArsR family transcriptional regulator, arsenate/arsenite/antimonite-responsive transcriptional, partial [Frankiales bacterium]|nr:ArsR family transcriptional regulator, arsenate/arsenite/antimonite-responsive transcriptional [Frankiales bacterium]
MTRTVPALTSKPTAKVGRSAAPRLDSAQLRLLGEPTRAAIVALLAAEQLCTCHLVEELGASQTNISNHLRVLREGGIVTASPCGPYTYYALLP